MPLITLPYDKQRGPYIDVFLSKASEMTFRKNEIEESTRKLTMLIDSGASKTAISKRVAEKMGLLPVGKTPLKSATQEVEANYFFVDIKCDLLPNLEMKMIKVVEFKFADGWVDGFLGRDFLEKVVFTINGPEETFSLGI